MIRRFASLLILSLGLAFAAPVLACAQLQQSHDCCPDQSPCGKCPPGSSLDGAASSCLMIPAASSPAVSVNRSDFTPDACGGIPASATSVASVPRSAADPPPPEPIAGAIGERTWLVTARLRL